MAGAEALRNTIDRGVNPAETRYDVAALRKAFPKDSVLINVPAIHGYEPQIIFGAIGHEVNNILVDHGLEALDMVMPSAYGKGSENLLNEEFPHLRSSIYRSDSMDNILQKTQFSLAGYQFHMKEVAEHQPQVQEELLEFLSRPFEAVSLAGEKKVFLPIQKKIEINTGANVVASEPGRKETHFAFPVVLSEMIAAVFKDPELSTLFSHRRLEQVMRLAKDFEAQYRTTLIPWVHTLFENDAFNPEGKTMTPPLKKRKDPPLIESSTQDGVLIMASGNETGRRQVVLQAERLHELGHKIFKPQSFGEAAPFAETVIPDVIFHPIVKAAMGRYGWGIGWLSQVAEKPFIALFAESSDNPEVRLNLDAMKKSGLGMMLDFEDNILEQAQRLTPGIRRTNERMTSELGINPNEIDGPRFAAHKIVEAEIAAS